ncbi:MAG: hypothetical protein V1703_00455 [Candidatus Altiarchaeota archaeon]
MKKKSAKKQAQVKPQWKNVYDTDYREYFVTQAQLSKSIRKDGIVHLTFYDENISPLQGKTKKPIVERKIKTTLIIPDKALGRIAKFLNNILAEGSKTKTEGDIQVSEENMMAEDKIAGVDRAKPSKIETSYIR